MWHNRLQNSLMCVQKVSVAKFGYLEITVHVQARSLLFCVQGDVFGGNFSDFDSFFIVYKMYTTMPHSHMLFLHDSYTWHHIIILHFSLHGDNVYICTCSLILFRTYSVCIHTQFMYYIYEINIHIYYESPEGWFQMRDTCIKNTNQRMLFLDQSHSCK
jgi:hypothetical protein